MTAHQRGTIIQVPTTSLGGTMAYSLRCADTGADCPGQFTTETEGELMEHIQMHAATAHPDLELDDATLGQIKSLVTQS